MLCEVASDYLKTLNPLAGRISEDIENIKKAYESLWDNLSVKEQEQIIDESIVYPDTVLKYTIAHQSFYKLSGCCTETGRKVITDEISGNTWLDEYSAPFSWKSRSQLQLCTNARCIPEIPPNSNCNVFQPIINSENEHRDEYDSEPTDRVPGAFSSFCARIKSLPGKSYDYSCQITHTIDDRNIISRFKKGAVTKLQNTFKMMGSRIGGPSGPENDTLTVKGGVVIVARQDKKNVIMKPNTPPPPAPRLLLRRQGDPPLLESDLGGVDHEQMEDSGSRSSSDSKNPSNSSQCIVPKSGFDFLDNW